MHGYIYIASAFETVNRSACGQKGCWVDNDPHFWNEPPTWGICRNDLRAQANEGDYVFFVLPKKGRHPQMIFGYLRIETIMSHTDAFRLHSLRSKRMGRKMPNGNIIVDAKGKYNQFDGNVHKYKFEKIKQHYAIGDRSNSRMLTDRQIRRLAPEFLGVLGDVVGKHGTRAIDIISRRGRKIDAGQVKMLLQWLKSGL
jgi:hypothetical protein